MNNTVRRKVTLTMKTTLVIEAESVDVIEEWAYLHTPKDAVESGGIAEYGEEIDLCEASARTQLFLGGDSYIEVEADGESYTAKFSPSVNYDHFFTNVSRRLCFADCSGENVKKIIFHGKECFYRGWQPDMVYSFTDNTGSVIWEGEFPEWEH